MIKIEVKVSGKRKSNPRAIQTIEFEPLWIDWNEYHVVPMRKRSRLLITNGHLAFELLQGEARKRHLDQHGFKDVEYASWEDVPR